MKTILFLDYVAPKAYTGLTLDTEAMGGTEATVVRIAERLVSKYNVVIEQAKRDVDEEVNGVHYTRAYWDDDPKVVITLRSPQLALIAKEKYPKAYHFLWLHDLATIEVAKLNQQLIEKRIHLLVVSEFHRSNVLDMMQRGPEMSGKLNLNVMYNPIDDGLKKDTTPVKANKVVYFSSPHKGLDWTLEVFDAFQYHPEIADTKLFIANPGYFTADISLPANVVNLGSVPHKDIIKHVRESLCVLHLNHVFPETFGLVYAEANAVGTPFITHNLGATNEVSDHPAQLLDTRNPKTVIDRVIAWRSGARPKVMANTDFYLSNIIRKWYSLLEKVL